MSLSLSQIVAICSSVSSVVAIAVGDLSSAALLPAHAAAVLLGIVAAVSVAVSQIAAVVSPPAPPAPPSAN